MNGERRKSKRLRLDVAIQLECISDDVITTEKYLHVEVVNISTTGLAFKSKYELKNGSCYDTKLKIWTKEEIRTIIKIVRCEKEEDEYVYGCIFIGLPERETMKIEIYQLFHEKEE